jgi:RNA polymerase primary sigma factor
MSLGEVAQLMDERNPEVALLGVERKEQVAKMLSKLTPREASILSRRFGIDDRGEMTQVEIADEEGVSKERIRQIEAKAMRKLRSFSRRDSQIAELVADACDDA